MLNGKFKCIYGNTNFMKKGIIYEFKNGNVRWDSGAISLHTYKNIEHFNKSNKALIEKYEEDKMTKDGLKNGMVVEFIDGKRALFLEKDTITFSVDTKNVGYFLTEGGNLYNWSHNLKETHRPEKDVVKVYSPRNLRDLRLLDGKLIWEREEKSEAQIKLEELEKQQRDLADQIAEIRKSI